jgi:hypothetical protein
MRWLCQVFRKIEPKEVQFPACQDPFLADQNFVFLKIKAEREVCRGKAF